MNQSYSSSWYDVTRELRRLAISGRLADSHPESAAKIQTALEKGGRIVFSPQDEVFFQEFDMDEFLHDPGTGKTMAVRKL